MAAKLSPEEKKILAWVQKLPFDAETQKGWVETLEQSGMNEDMAKEIRTQAAALVAASGEQLNLARSVTELGSLINRWRLSRNLPRR